MSQLIAPFPLHPTLPYETHVMLESVLVLFFQVVASSSFLSNDLAFFITADRRSIELQHTKTHLATLMYFCL